MNTVWTTIDQELTRRDMTWAKLGREIGATDQAMNNWSRRKVPAHWHSKIARTFGWTIEQLIGVVEPSPMHSTLSAPEPSYTKRAHDIARMFDDLEDSAMRQRAYVAIQAIFQLAKPT